MTMFLPDVNVWIALAFATHVHHVAAKNWFDGLPSGLFFFCRMTQQGFLRLATDPRVLQSQAVTLPEAWKMYDTVLRDVRISFSDEPVGVGDRGHARRSSPVASLHLLSVAPHVAGAIVCDPRAVP